MSKLTPFVPHSVSVISVAHLEASLTHDYVYFAGKRVTRLAPGPPQNHAKNSRRSFLAHSNGDSVSSSAYAGRCSLATTATMAWLTWEDQLPAEPFREIAGDVQGAWTTVWRWIPDGEEPRLLLRITWGIGGAWQWAAALVLSGRCRFAYRRCSTNAVFAW